MATKEETTHIIGGGPAGLTAAHELAKDGYPVHVLEKSNKLGGIARTEERQGNRFDIGGHRFYTKLPEIQQLWEETLGDEFIRVSRLSRIYYLGKFFEYPINPVQVFKKLGLLESFKIIISYFKAKLFPMKPEETFEQWVSNRFGQHLYKLFFKTYTEKVWGIPCDQIRAEWAAQRIMDLSIGSAIRNAVLGDKSVRSLIDEFYYPIKGPGMMWEEFARQILELDGQVDLASDVISLHHHNDKVTSIYVDTPDGEREIKTEQIISSMPIDELVNRLAPPLPRGILQAANDLNYRAFILVGLVHRGKMFPDNWIYVHSPDFKVGRIQNFKNWSIYMVSHPELSNIGMEYFCNEGDELWNRSDEELVQLATNELGRLGLTNSSDPIDSVVYRQLKAYPIYDKTYRKNLDVIRDYLNRFSNLQTIGRNGMFRYNNQDHSMLTGILAAQNVKGANHNLWTVNTERSYYEDFEK